MSWTQGVPEDKAIAVIELGELNITSKNDLLSRNTIH